MVPLSLEEWSCWWSAPLTGKNTVSHKTLFFPFTNDIVHDTSQREGFFFVDIGSVMACHLNKTEEEILLFLSSICKGQSKWEYCERKMGSFPPLLCSPPPASGFISAIFICNASGAAELRFSYLQPVYPEFSEGSAEARWTLCQTHLDFCLSYFHPHSYPAQLLVNAGECCWNLRFSQIHTRRRESSEDRPKSSIIPNKDAKMKIMKKLYTTAVEPKMYLLSHYIASVH